MNKLIFILILLPSLGFGQIIDTLSICNGDSVYLFNNWEEQTGNYTNGIDVTTLIVNPTPTVTGSFILNGNATQPIANTYQLTQAAGNQSGSAWNSVTLNLTQPFIFDVDVFLGYNNGGADGMAFLLQQVSTIVGTSGGGLGYQGISPSFAVEFDTWQNSSDPSYDHLAVQKNGDLNHSGVNNLVPFTGFPPGNSNIEDGLWHNVVFSWNPSSYNFKVVYDGVTIVNYTNNIVASIFGNNPNVYWGFTAATGGANNIQQFRVNSLGVELSDETICYSDTIQIDPQVNTSLYSYLWTPNYNISNNTIPSPLFYPDTSSTYYLEITNTYGCSQTDSLTINVDNSASNITFPFPSQFCLGISPINLNSATPIGGNYLVNNSASTIFNPNTNDIGVNLVTYSYTNSNGCSNSITNNISVYDSPVALCTSINASCNGFTDGSATLSISGGTPNYTSNWAGNNPAALGAGTYGYSVTDVNSCTFADSIIIYEPEIFTASINTTTVSCNGGNNGTANIELQGSSTPPGTVSNLSYCTSTPGSNLNSTIDNVQLIGDIVSINNNTSGICDQYEDYTNLYADVTEGQSYTIDVDLGDCSNTNFSSGGKVYIDWNIDGDFNDPGEEVGVIAYGISSSASIAITIPFSGVYGATRMRVVSQYQMTSNINSISSCDAGIWAPSYIEPWFGATEDYSIVISASNITATYNWSNGLTSDSISGLSAGNYSVDIINENGCMITNYINITEPPIITGTDNVGSHCDSYIWPINGTIYNSSNNTATETLIATSGCDSIVTLNLTINNSTTSTDYQTACNSYTWIDGNTYTSNNNSATFISTNAAGCDNVATLNLTINNSTSSIDTQTACDSYTWIDGNTYTSSNNSATFTSTNAAGCDNVATLNLIINNYNININDTACGEYVFNGVIYDSSGTYTNILTDINGCDSIINLTLKIFEDSSISNITECDSAEWNGVWYYNDTIVTTTGLITTNTFGGATATSSGKEGNIWYFGQNAGLDFNSGSPVALADGQLNTLEGCASISDQNGDLLFYSDGGTVFNRNHILMPNGTGLLGNNSSTQSAIIVQKPNSSSIYYLFTVDGASGGSGGLSYSEVDITLDGGLGNINTNKNILLIPQTCEKVTAVKHQNGTDFWIVSRLENSNTYHSYLLTSLGVNTTPIVTNIGTIYNVTGGYMKASPDGSKIASANDWNGSFDINLLDFNKNTGLLSNLIILPVDIGHHPYGVEFSTDGNILYISTWHSGFGTGPNPIFQYNLLAGSATAIVNSKIDISSGTSNGGAIQLAPDGKIYQTRYSDNSLGVISNPNILGLGANYNPNGCLLAAGSSGRYGLPTFYSSIFNSPPSGCDSVATAIITINNSNTSVSSKDTCNTYTWIEAGNMVITSTGDYTYTFTNQYGCDSIHTLSAIIKNSNTGTSLKDTCDTYIWSEAGNMTITASGNYTYIFTNQDGCDSIHTLSATINYSNSGTSSKDTCDTYTWVEAGNMVITATGNYNYTFINKNGCDSTHTLNATIGYSDDVDLLIIENHVSCFGNNDGSIILTPNGGSPPFQYLWDNGSVNQNLSALAAGDYSFVFTDSHGCTLDSVASINEPNQIFLDFIATSPICRYDESVLSISISNSISNSYTMLLQDSIQKLFIIDTNGLLIPEGIPISLSPNYSGKVYIISLTNDEGCTEIFNDDVHIEVKQLPQLFINEEDVCEGSPSFNLNNATPNGGYYSINNNLTNYFDVENLNPGEYNIGYNYTDPITSCSNQINKVIAILESPNAGMLFSPQPTNIDDPNIYFRDNSNEIILHSEWDLGDGTIINDEINFWYTYQDTGTYTIKYYITNIYQCTDSIINDIIINPIYLTFVPDAFTPNNDGDNDYFYPSIIGGNGYIMKIYNRWGQIIYNEENGIWDGTIDEKPVQHGIYSYYILVNDFKNKPFVYTGLVTLIK